MYSAAKGGRPPGLRERRHSCLRRYPLPAAGAAKGGGKNAPVPYVHRRPPGLRALWLRGLFPAGREACAPYMCAGLGEEGGEEGYRGYVVGYGGCLAGGVHGPYRGAHVHAAQGQLARQDVA